MIKGFTAQELAELAAFDAEVDAEEAMTPEEFKFAREMDKTAMRNRLDNQTTHRKSVSAAYQRAYREQNREEIAAKKRAYYEQNREEIAAYQRAYREQNREEIAAKKRGALLRSVRKARKESQKTVAIRFRVSQPAVSFWETGCVPIPAHVMDWAERENYRMNMKREKIHAAQAQRRPKRRYMGGISKFTEAELEELQKFDRMVDRSPANCDVVKLDFLVDAERFRAARRAARLTQKALGELLGVGDSAISSWENGYTKLSKKAKNWLENAKKNINMGVSEQWTKQPW